MAKSGESSGASDNALKLLELDYKHMSDSMWKNEDVGESRVRFFIMLVTAVAALLGSLATAPSEVVNTKEATAIAASSLLAVLAVGVVTLRRMI